ncbi:pentapeptide repeat-containing protein [Phocaeicola sp.]|jgi:hypothetical protein|uniref:pentapeptide repeat-containing protein n=1 Tax=Phocaeicola sp. TaxID=2773926 RepID=UPI00307B24D4
MNKIKAKWSDPIFLEQVSPVLELFTQSNIEMSNLDLSGIELGCSKSSVIQLRNAYLKQSKLAKINMSYSFIDCLIFESFLCNVDFFKAKFDTCLMSKSIFKECNFRKSKLVINADDAIFENCCFIDAKFGIITYGHEYGGRRTKFYDCDFTDAEFKNVEFRASRFYNCDFTRTRFISCDLRGAKFEGNKPTIEQYERMKIPEMIPEYNISNRR